MRFLLLTALGLGGLGLALGGECRAGEPERTLLIPTAEDAGSEGAAELPPVVAKACVDAGLAAGSPEHRQCGVELGHILRSPHGPGQKADAPPALTVKGFVLGAACARYYPVASRRAGEEGTVSLLVYVGADGRIKEVVRLQSSGVERLDVATASCLYREGRFEPRLVGHAPVGSWQRMTYTWRLRG